MGEGLAVVAVLSHGWFTRQIEGFRNAKLGIAISVTTVFTIATSELEK